MPLINVVEDLPDHQHDVAHSHGVCEKVGLLLNVTLDTQNVWARKQPYEGACVGQPHSYLYQVGVLENREHQDHPRGDSNDPAYDNKT